MVSKDDGDLIDFMSFTESVQVQGVFVQALGALLFMSLFLPWVQDFPWLLGDAPEISGFSFNPITAAFGFFGGILVLIASFIRDIRIRASVYLGVGFFAFILFLVVQAIILGSHIPVGQTKAQAFLGFINEVIGCGAFLYCFSALAISLFGAAQLLAGKD